VNRFRALIAANVVLVIAAVVLIASGQSSGDEERIDFDRIVLSPSQPPPEPTYTGTLQRPTTAPDIDVNLDPAGRPYDVSVRPGATIERRRLTVIHAPSRRVAFLGGEEVPYPYLDKPKTIQLAERAGRLYPVDAIRLSERSGAARIVGVVIVERDTPVTRWRTLLETAYGTDAGLGAITTREWLNKPEGRGGNVLARHLDNWPKAGFYADDVDGHPGVDTVVFDNGFGDGGFPGIAGYDASGARAAIVLWTIIAPWRLAFPQGEPPQRVTQREDALAACLAGRRTIDGAHCRLARSG
jgi:hypothetical protein